MDIMPLTCGNRGGPHTPLIYTRGSILSLSNSMDQFLSQFPPQQLQQPTTTTAHKQHAHTTLMSKLLVSLVCGNSHTTQTDGKSLVLQIISYLISHPHNNVHIHTQLHTQELALRYMLEYINNTHNPLRVEINWGDTRIMTSLVRGVIISKVGTYTNSITLEYLCVIILQAFLASLQTTDNKNNNDNDNNYNNNHNKNGGDNANSDNENSYNNNNNNHNKNGGDNTNSDNENSKTNSSDNNKPGVNNNSNIDNNTANNNNRRTGVQHTAADVKRVCVVGPVMAQSEYFKGVVLDLPVPVHLPQGASSDTTTSAQEIAHKELHHHADRWAHLGVRIVACQRTIDPQFRQYLHSLNIITLERLSQLHIDAVASVSGATTLGLIPPPQKLAENLHVFGYIHEIHTKMMAGRTFTYISSGDNRNRVASLVLCAPDSCTLKALENATRSAMAMLSHQLYAPGAVAGGGCIELHLAHMLRSYKYAHFEVVAQALEASVLSLDGAIGHVMLEKLAHVNRRTLSHPSTEVDSTAGDISLYGWDPRRHRPACVVKKQGENVIFASVVDAVWEKVQSLSLAITAANTLLRVHYNDRNHVG